MNFALYFWLIIIPMLLGLWAQFRVKSAFGKYSQIRATSNLTGAETALTILNAAGIRDVRVEQIDSLLGDHSRTLDQRNIFRAIGALHGNDLFGGKRIDIRSLDEWAELW